VKEIWKAIDGYNSMYEVSNLGNVRSHYKHSCPLHYDPDAAHPVSQHEKNRGYLYVKLSNNGQVTAEYVHRLVARYFLEVPEFPKATVNHIDRNKKNNRADNLEWMTRGDNCRYAIGSYERPKGIDWHTSKLNDEQVRSIRKRRENGELLKDLAKSYGMSVMAIQNIVTGKTWKHIQ
jgi:hypothetical protein